MRLIVMVRRRFSGHKNYFRYKKLYRSYFLPTVFLFKDSTIFLTRLLGLSLVYDRYAILDEPRFSKHVLVNGINGLTFIGKKYYVSKNIYKIDYRSNAKIQSYLSGVQNFSGASVIPSSILEASIVPEGKMEIFEMNKKQSYSVTHIINPGSNTKVLIPLEQSFFHFYIQIVPFILQNFSKSSIYLELDSTRTNLQILNCI